MRDEKLRSESSGPAFTAVLRFLRTGGQYYLLGRFSVIAGLYEVSGTVLHHAIEMLLKGALYRSGHSLTELFGYRDNLKKLWRVFKHETNDPLLQSFDAITGALDKFETIRYPDKLIREGAEISFALSKGGLLDFVGRTARPKYAVTVEEIDELVFFLLRKSDVDPTIYLNAGNSKHAY